jgi:hypothetical protein
VSLARVSATPGCVLLSKPGAGFVQFVGSGSERDAVGEVGAPIAEGEKLTFEQVSTAQSVKSNGNTDKEPLNSLTPAFWKHINQLRRPIVQPIIDKLYTQLALVLRKGLSCFTNRLTEFGGDNVYGRAPFEAVTSRLQARRLADTSTTSDQM